MRELFRKIRDMRFRYEPLILITIYHNRLIHNLKQFQAANPRVAVAPVLKSNAYGHGLVQIAKALIGQSSPFMCVDSYVEALILRNSGVRTPLLIIGYTPFENMNRGTMKDTAFGIMSIEELRRLSELHHKMVTIHLKIDTGMHRQGIRPENLPEALDIVSRSKTILLEGIYSHLADADTPASSLTKAQIELWNEVVAEVKGKFSPIRFFHLANTAGSRYAKQIDANVMRLGIGLYGIDTDLNLGFGLLPVLEMETRITSVRKIMPGESVGYNSTFTAERETVIATIPVGYAEGVDRRLSNKGAVTVAGVSCRLLGLVNMNMSSINVSRVSHPRIDDRVVVISAEREAPNSIENIAKLCGTIPYELLVHLPAQIRRVVK